ncbi:MAG: plastocyanin/azurin family copper-binding protein [Thermodesulfobacteriota bacterium]
MSFTKLWASLLLIIVFTLSGTAYSFESKLVNKFLEAYDAKDAGAMAAIVEDNKDKIPSEILALLYEAMFPSTKEEDKTANLFIAELIAKTYKDSTGDFEPLLNVKRTVFNSKLSEPVTSSAKKGVHIVELPKASKNAMNVFSPDNIIIKQGETVSWVNKDKISHVFASMPVIGEGGIFTPDIEPGKSWKFKFNKPGDYYYICFIHKGMVGKVTVETVGE